MAKIKNTGGQPRGFIQADGSQIVVPPGGEADVNLSEADFKNLQKVIENSDDPKPFEIGGSHGHEEKKKEKKSDEGEMPAQSTEPPAAPTSTVPPSQTVLPAENERRQQAAAAKKEPEKK